MKPASGAQGTQEPGQVDALALRRGLTRIRQRRWFLWLAILIYVPGLFVVLELGLPSGMMVKLFGAWVGLVCVAVGLATVVKCPRCGNPFHTHGPTFLPARCCVHCSLHVTADKTANPTS